MANPTQQPNQSGDCQEQDSYQPVSNQPNGTYGADDFDLALFNTADTSTENFWAGILTGLALDPINQCPPDLSPSRDDDDAAAAATHLQQTIQTPLPTSAPPTSNTSVSDSDQPRQYPVTHPSNNNDMVTFIQTEGTMSRQENRYGRQSTSSTAQQSGMKRKRNDHHPATASHTYTAEEATQQLHRHGYKQPRTSSATDAIDNNDNNSSSSRRSAGASHANPLVLEDNGSSDDSSDNSSNTHSQQLERQHRLAPPTQPQPQSKSQPAAAAAPAPAATSTTPTTTPSAPPQPPSSSEQCSPNTAAVAFAIQETITLPTTLGGGRAHRTYAFSPACNVGVRRGGKLVSVVKRREGGGGGDGERQVLHFTANKGAGAAAADHRGEESRRRGAAAAADGESNSHENNHDDNNNNDGNGGGGGKSEPDRTHSAGENELDMPFKVVGFGPCERCCRQESGTLCDRSYPCRACVGQAGGDVAAAMELCRLPVVERPDDAVDGDELIERGVVRVVRPGMAVVVEEE
ncbi:hypothetical protein SLS54_005629 [Diplodia seriata]